MFRLNKALGHREATGSIWRRANPIPSVAALSRPAGPIRGFCWIQFEAIMGHRAVYNAGSWANSTPSASPLQRIDGPTRSHRQRRLGEALGHQEATGSIWWRANPMPSVAALLRPAGPIRGFCWIQFESDYGPSRCLQRGELGQFHAVGVASSEK